MSKNPANSCGARRGWQVWGRKGVILYAPDSGGPIWRVDAENGGGRQRGRAENPSWGSKGVILTPDSGFA